MNIHIGVDDLTQHIATANYLGVPPNLISYLICTQFQGYYSCVPQGILPYLTASKSMSNLRSVRQIKHLQLVIMTWWGMMSKVSEQQMI